MRKTPKQATKKDPSRPILAAAIGLMGFGVLLLVISVALGSSPMLQAVGRGFRVAVPYLLLAGFALLVLYVVMRPRPDSLSRRASEPTLFGKETTDFAPSLERSSAEDPTLPAHRGQQPPATTWCARVFEDIEWRRFEALCESLFAQAGFETRTESHGPEAGADTWLYAPGVDAPAAVVHCRHWPGKPVGVTELRDFFGVMASHKPHRGTFATSSTFSADAQQFAKEHGISALDGPRLLAQIASRTTAQQHALLAIAYEGEYWRPTCANCGIKMVERPKRDRKASFWGCTDFPRCRFTLPARAAALAGAARSATAP
jgi:restriction system protein